MRTSLSLTTENLSRESGAGRVVGCEISAQAKIFDKVKVIDGKVTNPEAYGLPFEPYFFDYMASQLVRDYYNDMEIAHSNGDPYARTFEEILKKNAKCKLLADCPAHDLKESIKEWEDVAGGYPFTNLSNPFLFKLYLKHLEMADIVIAPAELSRKWLSENLKIKRIEVVRHGTDIPEYKPIPSDFIVGYFGRGGPDKGLKYLFSAWEKFQRKGTLRFGGGSGERNEVDEWLGLASGSLIGRVEKEGYVENKFDFFNNIQIYVQPSVTEGFGIPILEAMASGRPVIGSSGAGASELIEDGKSGFVVNPRSPDEIIDKIYYFYDNPSEIVKMGNNARETAKKYSWDIIRDQYQKFYEELLNE